MLVGCVGSACKTICGSVSLGNMGGLQVSSVVDKWGFYFFDCFDAVFALRIVI